MTWHSTVFLAAQRVRHLLVGQPFGPHHQPLELRLQRSRVAPASSCSPGSADIFSIRAPSLAKTSNAIRSAAAPAACASAPARPPS